MKPVQLIYTLVLFSFIAIGCKKNDSNNDNPDSNSLADRQKDTAEAYTRDIYLWYDQIPASFDGRSYADLNAMMEATRAYSVEPGFTNPVDRWSFAVKKEEWDNVSTGVAKDFGLNVFFRAEGDLRVRIVEQASPAGLAGVRRGWRVTKINGSSNITTANASFIVNAIYSSNNVTITFLKPDGNSADIVLTAATYQQRPVMKDSVYTVGATKVGYMVYNSFLGDSAQTSNEFSRVFNRFMSENISDVVIDLRYNGGGYVSYQRELANYLVNNSANGGVMMKQVYNNKYSQFNTSVNFSKKGTLNLPRIFIIVSNNSASASELLINNLKPYMNVLLVGPSRTYGKPVGYFNIPVGDYYIFPVSSRTTNKNMEGNYFDGFALNSTVADGLDKDWGDENESCLASALKYIGTGAFRAAPQDEAVFIENPVIQQANKKISAPEFKGMINEMKAVSF